MKPNENLFEALMNEIHLMVAGATGSGKSNVINGIITKALYKAPTEVQFILIDPKKVELIDYADLPHTITYASSPKERVWALKEAVEIADSRYDEMQARRVKEFWGSHLYVVIDELADLMTTQKNEVLPSLQRLAQIGRAARVHLFVATQHPLSSVIDTSIKCNIDTRIALRTRNRQDSRNIMDVAGCETLPKVGKAFYVSANGIDLIDVPKVDEEETQNRIAYWTGLQGSILEMLKAL